MHNTKFKLIPLLVSISLFLTSCSSLNPEGLLPEIFGSAIKQKGTAAIEYLENKYGKEFTPLSYDIGDYLSNQDTVECNTDGMNPEEEHVTVTISKDHGKMVFSDNYMYYRLRDDIETEYLKKDLAREYSGSKIYLASIMGYDISSLDVDATWRDVIFTDEYISLYFWIFINKNDKLNDDEFDRNNELLTQRILETGRTTHVRILEIDDDSYKYLDRYKASDLTSYDVLHKIDNMKIFRAYDAYVHNGEIKIR